VGYILTRLEVHNYLAQHLKLLPRKKEDTQAEASCCAMNCCDSSPYELKANAFK